MASYVTPKKNTAFVFYTALTLQSDTKLFKADPTLASGDAKVSIDGGSFANLTTLPDAQPDSGYAIRVQLSADEMNGDNIVVYLHDASGAEWCDLFVNIQTTASQVDDLATATALATVDSNVDAILDDTGTAGVIVASLATDAISAAALSTAAAQEIADAILTRDWTAVTGEAARSALNALRFLRNRWSISGTTLTVTKENDSTAAWTGELTTASGTDGITAVDPA